MYLQEHRGADAGCRALASDCSERRIRRSEGEQFGTDADHSTCLPSLTGEARTSKQGENHGNL